MAKLEQHVIDINRYFSIAQGQGLAGLALFCFLLTGCLAGVPSPPPSARSTATAAVVLSEPSAEPPSLSPTPIPLLTSAPTSTIPPIPSPAPTATSIASPKPLPFTLAGLRETPPDGQKFQIIETIEQDVAVTHSAISYQSDGLTITGRMHHPTGEGPFPVLILIHGFMPREAYWSGWGTWQSADYFARRGYIAIAPDLRSWGGSDSGLSLFQTGLVRDVINLITAVEALPAADTSKIGLWGHSMGGGIATKVALTDMRVDAAVLYAPNSADDADLIARWGAACRPGEPVAEGCNPSEILPPDTDPALVEAYFLAAGGNPLIQEVAPIYHLADLTIPVQIHIGSEDGQALSGTPPEWSAKLAAELEAAGRPYEYFVYEGQGHFFEGESWVLMMERSLTLFEQRFQEN